MQGDSCYVRLKQRSDDINDFQQELESKLGDTLESKTYIVVEIELTASEVEEPLVV